MAIPVSGGVSDNRQVNAVLDGGYRWQNETGRGETRIQALVLDYATMSLDVEVWEINAFVAAMEAWEQVADIEFRVNFELDTPDMLLAVARRGDLPSPPRPGLLASQQGPSAALEDEDGLAVGIYLRDAPGWSWANAQPAGFGFLTLLHELGHGLGLAHPFDRGHSGRSPVAGRVEEISSIETVMAYANWDFDPATGYADRDEVRPLGSRTTLDYGHFKTPNALDIAAIQVLYGADLDQDDGDGDGRANDVYRLPVANEAGTGWTTIWDTGGIDWIRHTGARPAHISLEPSRFEPGETTPGGISQARWVRGGVMIADDVTGALARGQGGFRGVLIENASSGAGGDRITGNAASNELLGHGGRDSILGQGGADEIFGGDDGDALSGGDGGDILYGEAGEDTLRGGRGEDRLAGGAGDDLLSGGSGADRFVFRAGGGVDTVRDFGGGDTIDLRAYDGLSFREIVAEARNFSVGVRLYVGDDEIRLADVHRGELTYGDFVL